MKQILFLFALSTVLLLACSEDRNGQMIVNGQVKGLKKGTLYLQKIEDSVLVNLDSLDVQGDGHFSFRTALESPETFYLYLDKEDQNDINDRIFFFGEPGEITISTAWNTFDTQAEITGSTTQTKWEEYQKTMSRFNAKSLELLQMTLNPEGKFDSIQIDSLNRLNDTNIKRSYAFALNYALSNKDSYIAPYIAAKEVPDANPVYLDSIYSSLAPDIQASYYGKELKQLLDTTKDN